MERTAGEFVNCKGHHKQVSDITLCADSGFKFCPTVYNGLFYNMWNSVVKIKQRNV